MCTAENGKRAISEVELQGTEQLIIIKRDWRFRYGFTAKLKGTESLTRMLFSFHGDENIPSISREVPVQRLSYVYPTRPVLIFYFLLYRRLVLIIKKVRVLSASYFSMVRAYIQFAALRELGITLNCARDETTYAASEVFHLEIT